MTIKQTDPKYRERVYKLVRRIPRGRVMTYGQIAELLGDGYTPRTVGFCMHSSPDGTPWQRVVNAQGGCSTGNIAFSSSKASSSTRAAVATSNNFCTSLKPDLRSRKTPASSKPKPEEKSDEFRFHATTRTLRREPAALFRLAPDGDHRFRAAELSRRAEPRRGARHRRAFAQRLRYDWRRPANTRRRQHHGLDEALRTDTQ